MVFFEKKRKKYLCNPSWYFFCRSFINLQPTYCCRIIYLLLPFLVLLMTYLADKFFFADVSVFTLIIFIIGGFLLGFFIRRNAQQGKTKFEKMHKEAELNKARITGLKEKIADLEKQNVALGGHTKASK